MNDRDQLLAPELERLPVPEHADGFFAELRGRLEQEARPRRRAPFRLPYLGAAAAAVAAALAIGLLDLTRGTETASAAEVRRAVVRALAAVERVSGVIVLREQAGGGETRWRFVLDADGNFRAAAVPEGPVWAYDAAAGVERYSDDGFFTVRTGVAPGPPDVFSSAWMVERGLGSVVAALDAAGDGDVRELEYDGRPAWQVRAATQNAGAERAITVDRGTGLPVRVVRYRGGREAGEWRIDELGVGGAPERGAFRLVPRDDQQVSRFDHGFRRTTIDAAAGVVGYAPLVPGWLPSGYELAEVAVARTARPPTGHEQRQNPASEDVVSIAYRRGLDLLVVTTRRVGEDRSVWSNPVARGDLSRAPERVAPARGALAGSTAEVVVDPNAVPHLWAMTEELVVTVAGDVTRAELIEVAESLRPRR